MQKNYLIALVLLLASKFAFSQSWDELNQKGFEYYNQGNYNQAISYAEKTLEHCQIEFGKGHKNYGFCCFINCSLFTSYNKLSCK